MPASNQVLNHAVSSDGSRAVTVIGADISAQSPGAMMQERIDDQETQHQDQTLESNNISVGPQQFLLTPGATTPLSDMTLLADCYPSGTAALKRPTGEIVLAEHLQEGDEILGRDGMTTRVAECGSHALAQYPYALVQISTEQGSFKLSAGCRIVVLGQNQMLQTIKAIKLRKDDLVKIGGRLKKVTRVQDCEERTELIWIRFEPDVSVDVFQISKWGIQTHGEEIANIPLEDASWMSVVPESVLAARILHSFSDSE